MSTTVSVIGFILAFFLMNFLVYKGLNNVITAFIATFVIIFTSGLDFGEAMSGGLGFVGMICGNFVGIFVFGGILASIYSASNATTALSRIILKPFGNHPNPNVRRIGTLGMLVFIRVVIGLAGIDNLAIMPFMVALVLAVFAGSDMPRKYINCALIFAGTIGTLIPGVPHQYVIILQSVMTDFNNSGNLVWRWLLLVIYIVGVILILNRLIGKDQEEGMRFDAGPLDVPDINAEVKAPHWLLTFVPVIVVYITYNFLAMEAWLSMMFGVIVATVLFYPYFPKEEGKKTRLGAIVESYNTGTFTVPLTIVAGMMAGFVLSSAPAFDVVSDAFAAIPIPAVFALMLFAIVMTGVGGAQTALVIVGSVAVSKFIPNGLGVQIAGVIALWSTSVLDTLPNNLGIIMQSELTAVPIKQAYPSIFHTTVVATLAMCVVVCIIGAIGLI